jgi:hypothetical protein
VPWSQVDRVAAVEVAALLGREDESELLAQVRAAVEVVSQEVCARTGLTFPKREETSVLQGTRGRRLVLGARPVHAVAAVILDGAPVASSEYRWHRRGFLDRPCGWGDGASTVAVTLTVGLDEVPGDVAAVVRTASARLATNPTQLGREEVEGYSALFGPVGFTVQELAVLDRWRRRTLP